MTEYSRMAKGYFTSTGAAKVIQLPFKPDYVEYFNYTVANSAATSQNIAAAQWDVSMGQGYSVIQGYNATPALIYDTVTSNGISTFDAGQLLQFGPNLAISGITKASPAVVTTTTNHNLASGDVVVFQYLYQSSTTGMAQLDTIPFTVTVTGATTFTINWNTNQSNFTALSGSPTDAIVKKVLYPYIYQPNVAFISAITLGTTTTVVTANAHNMHVGQEVAFRIPSAYGTTQLNSLPNSTTPGSPRYGYVVSVTDANTVVVNINSSNYTAFNSNQPFASVSGQQFPQMVAVGDVNTGGAVITSTSPLYPPPYGRYTSTTQVPTINGPAIQGSFINNTAQGFIIGNGAGTVLSTAKLCGATNDVIYWRAFLHDLSV